MQFQAVRYELTLNNILEDTSTFFADLIGEYDKASQHYRYVENQENALVEIKVLDETIDLVRKSSALSYLKFDANRRTAFFIEDAQTRFEGELETVKLVYRPEYLFVHYRLYTQENIIAEIEMELKTEVPQA